MRLEKYLTIDWPESSTGTYNGMNSDEDIFEYYTNWGVQRQFGCVLYEIMDTKRQMKRDPTSSDFMVHFKVDGVQYTFHTKMIGDVYNIMFYPTKNLSFGNIKGSGYKGGIGAGVIQATKLLMDTVKPKYIGFNTNDRDLIRIYDKLVPFLEKRLNIKFIESVINGKDKSYSFEVINET